MSRRREVWIACAIGGAAAVGIAFMVARARPSSPAIDEVVMMEPFVSTPIGVEETVVEPPATAVDPSRAGTPGLMALSGAFAPVTGAPLGVALNTGRVSYRSFIEEARAGRWPTPDAIRLEEWIHAPAYDYAPPARAGEELAVHLEVAVAPWNPTHRLVRVGIRATPDPAGGWVRQVRAEITFDPGVVRSSRRLASDDRVVGSGGGVSGAVDFGPNATFTALYEVVLKMVEGGEELGSLSLSREITGGRRVVGAYEIRDGGAVVLEASDDFRFAVAVAGLGLRQRLAPESELIRYDDLIRWVGRVDEYDVAGRMEFVAVVTKLRTRR